MKDLNILNPVETVALSTEFAEVRQLPFLKALEFTKKISAFAGQLFDDAGRFKLARKREGSAGASPASVGAPPTESYELNLQPLAELIGTTSDLAVFLILNSTGKDQAWLEKLSATEGMAVLSAAIRLNLSPEILRLGNEVAAFLGGLFPKKAATTTTTMPKEVAVP